MYPTDGVMFVSRLKSPVTRGEGLQGVTISPYMLCIDQLETYILGLLAWNMLDTCMLETRLCCFLLGHQLSVAAVGAGQQEIANSFPMQNFPLNELYPELFPFPLSWTST